jgi:aspartyl aminopeptidase
MNTLEHFLNKGITQFHVVSECETYLNEHGFKKLPMEDSWKLAAGSRYYVTPYASCLIAFTIGTNVNNMRIATAHTDFPMLKVKPNPDMKKSGYAMINVEPYGGLIMSTWFDRPLGIAGKVVLKGENPFEPQVRLYDSEKAMCIIPNLAPHLKKGDSEGKTDPQKELIPIVGMEGDTVSAVGILSAVADKLKVKTEDILDYDLYLYNTDKVSYIGESENLISSPRIDNISSVSAIMESICEADEEVNNLNIAALFDNEEIGSKSKQGADSYLLNMLINRILEELSMDSAQKNRLFTRSFMISLDVAHGCHPNYPEKSDPTNIIKLGQGVVLKTSASQRYVTDSEASAVITAICSNEHIPLQKQVNKSGMPGGTTMGPIISSYLPIRAVDMGMPILAMHSARELAHIEDYREMRNLLKSFWLL